MHARRLTGAFLAALAAGCAPDLPGPGEPCEPLPHEYTCEGDVTCTPFESGGRCFKECFDDCDCPVDMVCMPDPEHFCYPILDIQLARARGEWTAPGFHENLCGREPDSCATAFDGVCDEPERCDWGTDTGDCVPSCLDDGASCTAGADCCAGTCNDGTCGDPVPPSCGQPGDPCTGDVDCCIQLCCGDLEGCC